MATAEERLKQIQGSLKEEFAEKRKLEEAKLKHGFDKKTRAFVQLLLDRLRIAAHNIELTRNATIKELAQNLFDPETVN
jgi:hypothetical protein